MILYSYLVLYTERSKTSKKFKMWLCGYLPTQFLIFFWFNSSNGFNVPNEENELMSSKHQKSKGNRINPEVRTFPIILIFN